MRTETSVSVIFTKVVFWIFYLILKLNHQVILKISKYAMTGIAKKNHLFLDEGKLTRGLKEPTNEKDEDN